MLDCLLVLISLPLAGDFPMCSVGRVYFLAPESSGLTTFFGQWNFNELDATSALRGASMVWLGLLPSWDPSREGCVLDTCWSKETVETSGTELNLNQSLKPTSDDSQPTPVFLPGKFHTLRSSVGLLRVRHDWAYTHLQMMSYLLACSVMSDSLRLSHSMGFPRQEYWSRLPFPPPGDLPNPGIELMSLMSPALAGGFFSIVPSGNPEFIDDELLVLWRTKVTLVLKLFRRLL